MAKLNPVELQKALKGVDYPAKKNELVKVAENNGSSEDVRGALDKLPDQTYETPADVAEAVDFGGGSSNE